MADNDLGVEDAIDYIRDTIRAFSDEPEAIASWRQTYASAFQVFDAIEEGLVYESDDAVTDLGLEHLNDFYHDMEQNWEYSDEQEVEVTDDGTT